MKACRPTGPAWAGEAGEMSTGHNADHGPGGHRADRDERDVLGDRDVFGDPGGHDGEAASRLLRLFEGHRLTPVQRRIAHCLARHAAEAPFLSSIEVAELAGVSQPSVTRFAMALGYRGYPGLRRRFRELGVPPGRGVNGGGRDGEDTAPDAGTSAPAAGPRPPDGGGGVPDATGQTGSGQYGGGQYGGGQYGGGGQDTAGQTGSRQYGSRQYGSGVQEHAQTLPAAADSSHRPSSRPGARARPAPRDPAPEEAPGKHGLGLDWATGPGGEYRRAVLAEIENLRALARSLDDPGPVAEAARLLAASRPLPVLGLRAAAAQAAGFAYFAAKIHPDVRPLHEAGSLLTDRVEQAAAAGATALLCFALPRYPAELVDALRAGRAAGLNVVTVADRKVPSLAGLSHVLLTAAVGTSLVFDTACAPMMLGRVLLEAMCDELPGAQARLEAFEASAAARGVFLID
ncbi:hypothetical protein AAH991_32515 [Microbispora sp. ZYX-F-249]|uniref:HTH rpiR-type domain-containing protein n=1 Tax=Microbispora maris TaxID=3144104 RepID=A0ABV0AX70_9ACTN